MNEPKKLAVEDIRYFMEPLARAEFETINRECPDCGGAGWGWVQNNSDPDDVDRHMCGRCEGTGYVSQDDPQDDADEASAL